MGIRLRCATLPISEHPSGGRDLGKVRAPFRAGDKQNYRDCLERQRPYPRPLKARKQPGALFGEVLVYGGGQLESTGDGRALGR